MPPNPTSRLGAGGGHSGSDCSVSGRARSPLPGPSGLGSGVQVVPNADQSCSGFCDFSSPAPLRAAEEDRVSVSCFGRFGSG